MNHDEHSTSASAIIYKLVPALVDDRVWLESLRRDVYQELFEATFGGWDEARHLRHFSECWGRGGICIIEVCGKRVGMVQLLDEPAAVEIAEIQIQRSRQNKGIGTRILLDTIARAYAQNKTVRLSVGLRNTRARRLYLRIGFVQMAQDQTHTHMAYLRG